MFFEQTKKGIKMATKFVKTSEIFDKIENAKSKSVTKEPYPTGVIFPEL
jgi:hypothetical protein